MSKYSMVDQICYLVWSANETLPPIHQPLDDLRTENLRKLSYGIVLPIICAFGIIGNLLNILVLTRKNMRGTAYIYMRGYSGSALLAIILAIPFGRRLLTQEDYGRWENLGEAFYTAHLELFLGNACLGVGVLMLLVLTIERYVSVCHPTHMRPALGEPTLTVILIPIVTFIIYLPSLFRYEVVKCVLSTDGSITYFKRNNVEFLNSMFYSVYKVILEIVFKLMPTVLIAYFNVRIMIVYRQTCNKRRRMTLSHTKDDDSRKFAEERRLMFLLGSTSLLFLVCVSPMVILHVTLSEENLSSFSYQVFRALANVMELTNYSITFYIYCLFSEDFRNTLIRTMKWPWFNDKTSIKRTDFRLTTTQPIITQHKIPITQQFPQHSTSGFVTGNGRSSSI
ncbi:probable G-protein coupled receptor B0563.6 [Chironomus tepperi]|uniref:probable G-protein coupled receptor B0563.6 n=1 Tax=Chironomus tepperi TaxID=113505 RepID=UPI00391F78FF